MLNIPMSVCSCLYSGICDKIRFVKQRIEEGKGAEEYVQKSYKDVIEAVEWYKRNCVISAKFLNDKLDELTQIYKIYMDGEQQENTDS